MKIEHMPAKSHNDLQCNLKFQVIPVDIHVAVFHDNEFKDAILEAEKNHLVVHCCAIFK